MVFDIAATAHELQSLLEGSGLFFKVRIARPGQPLGEGPSATIQMESMHPAVLTLASAIESHVLRLRLWRALNTAGEEARELESAALTSAVFNLLYGEYQLGGGIRAVDFGGIYGSTLSASFVDENIDTAPYHIADIVIPFTVDSDTVMVA